TAVVGNSSRPSPGLRRLALHLAVGRLSAEVSCSSNSSSNSNSNNNSSNSSNANSNNNSELSHARQQPDKTEHQAQDQGLQQHQQQQQQQEQQPSTQNAANITQDMPTSSASPTSHNSSDDTDTNNNNNINNNNNSNNSNSNNNNNNNNSNITNDNSSDGINNHTRNSTFARSSSSSTFSFEALGLDFSGEALLPLPLPELRCLEGLGVLPVGTADSADGGGGRGHCGGHCCTTLGSASLSFLGPAVLQQQQQQQQQLQKQQPQQQQQQLQKQQPQQQQPQQQQQQQRQRLLWAHASAKASPWLLTLRISGRSEQRGAAGALGQVTLSAHGCLHGVRAALPTPEVVEALKALAASVMPAGPPKVNSNKPFGSQVQLPPTILDVQIVCRNTMLELTPVAPLQPLKLIVPSFHLGVSLSPGYSSSMYRERPLLPPPVPTWHTSAPTLSSDHASEPDFHVYGCLCKSSLSGLGDELCGEDEVGDSKSASQGWDVLVTERQWRAANFKNNNNNNSNSTSNSNNNHHNSSNNSNNNNSNSNSNSNSNNNNSNNNSNNSNNNNSNNNNKSGLGSGSWRRLLLLPKAELLELSASKLRGLEQQQLWEDLAEEKHAQSALAVAKDAARRIPVVLELLQEQRSAAQTADAGSPPFDRLDSQLEALRLELRELDEERREDELRLRTCEKEAAVAVATVREQQLQREQELQQQLDEELAITVALSKLVDEQSSLIRSLQEQQEQS
ncbi:unnamed protein product, partial [Polarella glacialis]